VVVIGVTASGPEDAIVSFLHMSTYTNKKAKFDTPFRKLWDEHMRISNTPPS
jgi:hypothetical protein